MIEIETSHIFIKSKGKYYVVLLDEEDVDKISGYKWFLEPNKYVSAHTKNSNGKDTTIKMARLITDAPKGMEVDHINHNPLDNRKANLRVCTHADNMRNSWKKSKCYSKFKGISFKPKCKDLQWEVKFNHNSKTYSFGRYSSETIAAIVHDIKIKEYRGNWGRTNENVFGKFYSEDELCQALCEMNAQLNKQKSSKFKGVTKAGNKWAAKVRVNKRDFWLGRFNSEINAALAYDEFVIKTLQHSRKTNEDLYGKYYERRNVV